MKEDAEENDVLVQSLEVVLIALGFGILHLLGASLLIPMAVALILFVPCAIANRMMQSRP